MAFACLEITSVLNTLAASLPFMSCSCEGDENLPPMSLTLYDE